MSASDLAAAVAAHQAGDGTRARALYQAAMAADPEDPAIPHQLGVLEATEGDLAAAEECFRQALVLDPTSIDSRGHLLQAQVAGDQADAAAATLEEGLAGRDGPSRASLVLRAQQITLIAFEQAHHEAAWRLARRLVREPDPDPAITGVLAHCMRRIDPRSAPEAVREDLVLCLRADTVDQRELALASARQLEVDYRWIRQPPANDLLDPLASTGLADDPLLLALLERSINADPGLERILRAARAALLGEGSTGRGIEPALQSLLAALAQQCFSNEYVWWCGEEEQRQLAVLEERLADSSTDAVTAAVQVALLACYVPLHGRADSEILEQRLVACDRAWAPALRRRLLTEPALEAELAGKLSSRRPRDHVSVAVQEQYEVSPYPRWLCLEPQAPDSVAGWLAHLFPGLRPPSYLREPVEILVAGCGTGEHVLRVALRHPECAVTGIDLSLSSLGYAARKARELSVANLDLQQLDILDLPEQDGRFHVIESVGVIHHMEDPARGLAALCEVLRPGGVIKLGLYARAARGGVRGAARQIRALGLTPTPQGIRTLRRHILEAQDSSLAALTRSQDFYATSAVRDLLFHVQEHQYDLVELERLVRGAGLALVGFQAPAGMRSRYTARYPGDPWLANLENLRRFERENPGAFAGMYQFWCFRPPG